ncbi:hypothetical protein RR48_10372 [Papilio machaon]|uniref:Uncharacterized protein n=1 Tax=Papilio machaon TaxID=76193 RepID=A0A194RG31_PAPMA|nr:hypothetical protein RR48_10372 [Papilio machaon]
MWSVWRAWCVLALLGGVLAQRIDQDAVLSPRPRARDRDITKPDEPTCDQLKAMWSTYRDPLMYNEWPVYTAMPRAAPRFRYQYQAMPREAYGRVVTKAPPNVVRTPDYDEMFGMLNVPHSSGKILRYPGPSRPRGQPSFMVPPQRDRMWSVWRAWCVLALLGGVLAQRIDQDAVLSPRPRARDRDITKPDEPTCDQLKAMWRFSKRQARAPEIMNEVSTYRDPLMYNEWPVYTAMPRAAPRFRYQYQAMPREAYGRVVTKAPPNVVRTPDYDEMFGMLNVPHSSGKILRYPGPSRPRGQPSFMVPPQRDRNDDYVYGSYGENEPRGLQPLQDYTPDENGGRHSKKPPMGSRQVSQFSRYSDVMLPPVRRTFYHPYFDYPTPEFIPYVY